jgi:hypothetical protein
MPTAAFSRFHETGAQIAMTKIRDDRTNESKIVRHAPSAARPSAISPENLARACRYVNMLPGKAQREYGSAYLDWLKGGAVGHAPDKPRALSRAAAQTVRLDLDSMDLWNRPQAETRR